MLNALIRSKNSRVNLISSLGTGKFKTPGRTDLVSFYNLISQTFKNEYIIAEPREKARGYKLSRMKEGIVLARELQKNDFDLVHIADLGLQYILLWSLIADSHTPIIKHIFTTGSILSKKITMKINHYISRANRRFISVFSSSMLAQFYGLFTRANVIPPAVDTNIFKIDKVDLDEIQEIFSVDNYPNSLSSVLSSDFLILYMGPLTPSRFHFTKVLKMMNILNVRLNLDVGLLIIGRNTFDDAQYLQKIRKITNGKDYYKISSTIKFLTDLEKSKILNFSSALLYPIDVHRNLYNFNIVDPPLVLLEAMASGNRVITPPLLSIQKIIKNNENGFLLKSLIPQKMALTVANALRMDKDSVGENARITIKKRFSVKSVTNEIEKLHNKILI